ncbi:MAG: hypothetical protein ABR922_10600 [Streptosporangiaceae bacterium]|jgi:hypothetical protein
MTGAGLVIVCVVTGIVLVIAAVAASTPRAVRDRAVAGTSEMEDQCLPALIAAGFKAKRERMVWQCDRPGIGRPRVAQVIASLIS